MDCQNVDFFGFKLDMPCLGPVVKLNYFFLRNVVYLVYAFMRCCNSGFICIDCCVAMRANGGRDIPSVIVPYGGS